MPQVKKQPAKKPVKKSSDNSKELEKSVAYLIQELDGVKTKLDKVMSRMGL